jgi:hypothetical protein
MSQTMGGGSGATPLSTQPGNNILSPWSAAQLNANQQASALVRGQGQRYRQQILAGSGVPVYGSPYVVTVPVVNVGLVTKFFIEVTVTVTNPSGGSTLTRTTTAPFSMLSNLTYTDPNNYQRINTTGLHLQCVNAMRHRRVPGAALTTDTPSGFGSVIQPMQATSSIAASGTGTLKAIYEVPLAYSRNTLKGGVYAGAVFATQTLQFTINPTLAQNGTDPISTCYTGANNSAPPTYAASWIVWQEYWDGFPLSYLGNLSPDLSTIYELKTTAFSALLQNLDNFFRFANLRQFLGTIVMYDNGGVMNPGTDITYFKLQSANQTTEWQNDIYLQSYRTRQMFGGDFPTGIYPFDFRDDPIITAAEGNTVLILNPSSVQTNAYALVGWEDLATAAVLASAPSLSGSGGVSS